MTTEDDILKKLPKQTPLWAVGIVTIVISVSLSIGAFYTIARPEIQQYVTYSGEIAKAKAETNTVTIAGMFKLITDNSAQVTQLSAVLAHTQEDAGITKQRVANLEKDLAVTSEKLKDCEDQCSLHKK